MNVAPDYLIYESAHRGNILPLTSACNVKCIFCSHLQNPPGMQIYRINNRTLLQVEDALQFINPGQKIVIGESVTRIIEGEPFTHPNIKKILHMIRTEFPDTGIQITTNGTLMDGAMSLFLAELGNVEINLSLNTSSLVLRRQLMKDKRAETSVLAAENLCEAGVPYHGSIVAMPHMTGWQDLKDTIYDLAGKEARTIRVFIPGFTRLTPETLQFTPDLVRQLSAYINEINHLLDTPVILEPPFITDLAAEVKGVMAGSPAEEAGFRKGDVIVSVNGEKVFSRVDAFLQMKSKRTVTAAVKRGDKLMHFNLKKVQNSAPGLVMEYDISQAVLHEIGRCAEGFDHPYVLCSQLGAPAVSLAMEKAGLTAVQIVPVPSRFFGGSIGCAGLLTVADFFETAQKIFDEIDKKPDIFILPAIAFDNKGADLTGVNFKELQEKTGIIVKIA